VIPLSGHALSNKVPWRVKDEEDEEAVRPKHQDIDSVRTGGASHQLILGG
jgi:hypothetical protein